MARLLIRGIFLRQLWEDFSSQTEATVDVRFSLGILFVIITGEIALGPGFLWLSQSLFSHLISVIVIIQTSLLIHIMISFK